MFCKALGSSKSQANKRYKIALVFLKPVTIRIKQNWLLGVDYRNNAARGANVVQNLLEKRKKVLDSEVMCSWGHATCSIVNMQIFSERKYFNRYLVAGVKKYDKQRGITMVTDSEYISIVVDIIKDSITVLIWTKFTMVNSMFKQRR